MAEGEPVCSNCQITTSPIWRRNEEGKIVCLDCSSSQKKQEKVSNTETNRTQPAVASGPSITTRKKRGKRNARGGVEKASVNSINQTSQQKGRRSLLKGKPIKAPASEPRILTGDSVMYKGIVYETGDVVSLLDFSGGIYYAIVRGFLVDQYADKYAVLTWLLPRTPNPDQFDPCNFILGPDDDEPRKLQLLDFVCHSPNSKSFASSFTYNLEMSTKWLPNR